MINRIHITPSVYEPFIKGSTPPVTIVGYDNSGDVVDYTGGTIEQVDIFVYNKKKGPVNGRIANFTSKDYTASISAIVNNEGYIQITSATAHGLSRGYKVTIVNTANYNGVHEVYEVVDTTNVVLKVTYVADEATGNLLDGNFNRKCTVSTKSVTLKFSEDETDNAEHGENRIDVKVTITAASYPDDKKIEYFSQRFNSFTGAYDV